MAKPDYLSKKERPQIPADKLITLRSMVMETRDLEMDKKNAEDRLKAVNENLNEMYFTKLPDFMDEVGVRSISLEAEGNYPAFEAKSQPYHKANIAADWPDEKRMAAFAWLEENGHGDLIRKRYIVDLAPEDSSKAKELEHMLAERGFAFESSLAVPWNTLSMWLREQCEKHETPPLDIIGGKVGRVVKLKRKE